MSDNSSRNTTIAKNTIYLYIRTLIVMCVTLFTSRVILQSLGVQDFGIYNLVAGITASLSFLNGTLADATQRYITYEIGKGEKGSVSKIFSTCILLHIILALIVVLLLEPIGVWFINNKLQIPVDRLAASMWVFQFMIIQMVVLFVSVPYNALIIAHEKMSAFAMISVVDALMRLGIAYALMTCANVDRLIVYAVLMLCVQLILQSLYVIYCKINFRNVKYYFSIEKQLMREMSGFSSWTIIGNLAYICVTQGLNLLLGMFFLPVINAARGIAVQVQTAVNAFVKNFQTAVNPQITKTYASGQLDEMKSLVFRSSRFSFFLLMIPILPLFFETDFVLKLWLPEVPEYTSLFLKLILISSCINCLGNPLAVASKATGNIKKYEVYSASIKLLILPIAYIALRNGMEPPSVFVIQIFIEGMSVLSNIYITHQLIEYSLTTYLKSVLAPITIVVVLAFLLPLLIAMIMNDSWLRFFVLFGASLAWSIAIIAKFGLTQSELLIVFNKLKSRFMNNDTCRQ